MEDLNQRILEIYFELPKTEGREKNERIRRYDGIDRTNDEAYDPKCGYNHDRGTDADHANAGIHLYFRWGDDDPVRDL